MREYALRFSSAQDFVTALQLLDGLAAAGPVEYNLAGQNAAVLPEWVYRRLAPLLDEHGVQYERLVIIAKSALPSEEQARRRGFRWGRG